VVQINYSIPVNTEVRFLQLILIKCLNLDETIIHSIKHNFPSDLRLKSATLLNLLYHLDLAIPTDSTHCFFDLFVGKMFTVKKCIVEFRFLNQFNVALDVLI